MDGSSARISLRKNKEIQALSVLFVLFLVWRIVVYFLPAPIDGFNLVSFAWGATYQFVALWGAIRGFAVARSWGGWKSLLGRSIILFAVGLLFQSFGQTISSYFVYTTGEIPYPSMGDVGFFGSVIVYVWAAFLLAKVSGAGITLKKTARQVWAAFVFFVLLGISFLIFVRGQQFDWNDTLSTLLNIGYPILQTAYIAIAFLTYLLSKKYLGGIMKKPILLFLIALFSQYLADFTFLYQATHNLYIPEGVNDMMYFLSYFLMAVAIIFVGVAYRKIKEM